MMKSLKASRIAIGAFLACLLIAGHLQAEIRWNATLKERYRSEADGAEVGFDVRTPPEVAGIESYPLVVVLNGGLRVPPSRLLQVVDYRSLRVGPAPRATAQRARAAVP